MSLRLGALAVASTLCLAAPAAASTAPGAPGAVANWTAGDKTGFGTARDLPTYYVRLTVDGKPDAGTTYTIGDGGPTIDQRAVVDPSFLELVRLGVKAPDDDGIRWSLPVIDRELGVDTPNGRFWHRYIHDGYGETLAGGPFPGDGNTGRLWPIFAGERGEYELAGGDPGPRAGGCARSRRPRTAGGSFPSRCGIPRALRARAQATTRRPAASPAPARSRRRRWAGRTPSSCGSRGRSTPAGRSSSRRSSPAATRTPTPAGRTAPTRS
jgi:hypothetical protein